MFDIRTGVIGVGSMGQNHARIYNEISNLQAVADADEIQGKKIADKFGVKYYDNYKDLLKEVDAVTVSVPTNLHREVSENVIDSGTHLLVEKPLAASSSDAQAIVELASSKNVTLAVGHVERHNPVVSKAKKELNNKRWGNILSVSTKRFSSYPHRIRDVGVLFDLAIHDIDITCYLVDSDIKSIYVTGGAAKGGKYEDHAIIVMNFENEVIGVCETNWLTPMKVRETSITTDKYNLKLNYMEQELSLFSSEFGPIDNTNLYRPLMKVSKETIPVNSNEPLKIEIIDFLDSLSKNIRPIVSGEDGLRAVKIIECGLQSLESGSVVNIQK